MEVGSGLGWEMAKDAATYMTSAVSSSKAGEKTNTKA